MSTVDFTCRLCSRPGTADLPNDFDPVDPGPHASAMERIMYEIPKRWVPMLCHEFCYDVWSTRRQCERKISDACVFIERLDIKHEGALAARDIVKKKLEAVTERWAKNECRKLGTRKTYWQKELAEHLMQEPARWVLIMRNYRDMITEQVKRDGQI